MGKRNPTYYELLGIRSNAKHNDVGLAYNRRMAARKREDTPPDLKAETMLREAFEVLSDLDRRAEYDARLRAAMIKPAFDKGHALMAAGFVVAVAGGLYWYLTRPAEPPPQVGKPLQEILNGAIPAVARVRTLDMSGQAQPSGVAFTVEEGAAVTSCQGVSPTAVMSIEMGGRVIPARVTMSDEALGLCRLEVLGAGSWPLSVSASPAKGGDRVYAVHLGAKGEVLLREGMVRKISQRENTPVLEVTVPLLPLHGGAPLLDMNGRVVAVANMPAGSKGYYVPIPKNWGETPPPPPKPVAPVEEPSPDAKKGGEAGEIDELGVPLETRRKQEELARKISPERRERLEKAFRPPPKVPDDI